MEDAALRRALETAFRYLSPRPRSTWEMRQRLRRQGLEPPEIEEVVAWLRERGFLDDASFASFWLENRESFRPRGRRLLEQELRARGVDPQVLAAGLEGLDEEDSAWRAGQKMAQGLVGAEYAAFAAKLGGFLRRRGFSYEVASGVVRRLWLELGGGGAEATGPSSQGQGP